MSEDTLNGKHLGGVDRESLCFKREEMYYSYMTKCRRGKAKKRDKFKINVVSRFHNNVW